MAHPISSLAIQAMRAALWQEAWALWQVRLDSGEPWPVADYNACARTLECLGKWAAYRDIIERGLTDFPEDQALQVRRLHAQAIACMADECWQEAWALLEQLRGEPLMFEWPCALNYWSRQARCEKTLAAIEGKQERLAALTEISLFKASELLPQRVAGILLAVDCLDWPEALQASFRQRLQPLIDCLRCYDQPVRLIEDAALVSAAAGLADFWQGHDEFLSGLPEGDCEFFARLFLCFGYLDLYLQLRARFVSLLEAWGDERVSKVAFAYRVALANERADSAQFVRLRNIAQARADTQDYAGISAIYHVGHAYDCPVRDEDRDFAEYIQGKSIAIVGPVDVGLDSGSEIDGFDRVVRFNHRDGLGYEPARFGSRTDVSYYVKALLARKDPPPGLLAGMSMLDYAVFNKKADEGCAWLEQASCRKREQQSNWAYLENPMLMGYANSIPLALLDLLRFKPCRIKVFCSNLYTSMSYRSEYLQLSSLGRNGGNIFPNASLHDPVSNFLLMQRLVQTGQVRVDNVLKEIVAWSVPDYMERLRTAHAGFLALPTQGEVFEFNQ